MTGELTVVVKFNGMVSLRREGKSANFKRTKSNGKWFYAAENDPFTKMNIPNEDLDIKADVKSADQIIHIRPQTLKHWEMTPCSANQLHQRFGFKAKWENIPYETKIAMHLNDLVADLCQKASSGSQPLSATWYIQTIAPKPHFEFEWKDGRISELRLLPKEKIEVQKPKPTIERPNSNPENQIRVPGSLTRNGQPVTLTVVGYIDLSKLKK